MLLGQTLSFILAHWYLLIPTLCFAYLIKQKYQRGLNQYSGPYLASVTDLWRAFCVWSTRDIHNVSIDLHKKHGNVVRMGPNLLSFSDPAAIKDIYGLNKGFVKVRTCMLCSAKQVGGRPAKRLSD